MLKDRILYAAVFCAAVLFYIFFTGYLSFFTLAAAILFPVVSWIFTLLAVRKIRAELSLSRPSCVTGEEAALSVILENRSAFPVNRVRIRFVCGNSFNGETRRETCFLPACARGGQKAEFAIRSRHCGKITVRFAQVRYYDFLGIFSVTQVPAQEVSLFSAPEPQPLSLSPVPAVSASAESETYSKVKPGDDPSEIFDLRPYRSGDRLRSIHWKLSSKMDELMVKEFSLPTDPSLLLLCELLSADLDALDTVAETMVSLSRFLLENGINHSVEWYDSAKEAFRRAGIKSDEDLPVMLNAFLSARRYEFLPRALLCREKREDTARYPRIVYVTGLLTDALADFCERNGAENTAVLYCGEPDEAQKERAERLRSGRIPVVCIHPGKIAESLSGLSL